MWYETKKAILEAYGKDGKNVRWLEKAIQRGFVVEQNGMYAFKRDVEEVDKSGLQVDKSGLQVDKSGLQVEISGLKEENIKLRQEIKKMKEGGNNCEELKDHLKFFYEMDLARKEAMNNVIQAYFNKNQGAGWDDAVKKANEFMKFSENPYENEEIEYVKGLN